MTSAIGDSAGGGIAGVGDSVTDVDDNMVSYAADAVAAATYLGEAAVGGFNTGQMLGWFPAVADLDPNIVHILGGTNDSRQGVTLAQYAANITALVDKCRQIEARPILGAVIPNDGATGGQPRKDLIDAYNVWLADFCTVRGIVFVDYFTVLADENGDIAAEFDDDGTHPNDAGQQAMGAALAAALDTFL